MISNNNNSLKIKKDSKIVFLKGNNLKHKHSRLKGLTLNYLGTIDNKLGMSKKKITNDDIIRIKISNNTLFHNEKLASLTKFSFPKTSFQELKLPSCKRNNMEKKYEKEIIKKMDDYCLERLNGKNNGSLYNNPSINLSRNSHFFSESVKNEKPSLNTITSDIKRITNKKLYINPIKFRFNSIENVRNQLFDEFRPHGLSQYIIRKKNKY